MVKMEKENIDIEAIQSKPPYCNTGAGNTSVTSQRSLVDWLQVTIHGEHNLQQIKEVLGLPELEFIEHEKGFFGYQNMVSSCHINIMWNDYESHHHIMMTGQGCRYFEQLSSIDWRMLFGYLLHGVHAKFTRLDLAIDDFKNTYNVGMLRRKIKNKEVISKLRTADDLQRVSLKDATLKVDSLRFGSETSRFMIRVYDKNLEQEASGHTTTVETWTRTELQFRKEYSNLAANELYNSDFVCGDVVKGYLNNYIRFSVKGKDQNRSRWKNARWWDSFLNGIGKLKLSLEAPDATIERSMTWIDRQVAPALLMIEKAVGEKKFTSYIEDIMNNSEDRLTDKHKTIINNHISKEIVDSAYREKTHHDRIDKIKNDRKNNPENYSDKLTSIFKQKNAQNPEGN